MSTVDYIIASSNLFDKFSSFIVDDYDVSDHFPLRYSLRLGLKSNMRQNAASNDGLNEWHKYKWKEFLKDEILHKFDLYYSEFRTKLQLNENNVSFYLQDFVKVFQSAGDLMKVHFRHHSNLDNKHKPPWWNSACEEAKLKKASFVANI